MTKLLGTKWLTGALLTFVGLAFALSSLSFSQEEDMGFFLSMASSLAQGLPLYTGFFETKDPIFLWLSSASFMILGKGGPSILDALAVFASPWIGFQSARALGLSRPWALLAGIAFTSSLAGAYFQSFRTGTLALVLIVASIYFVMRKQLFLVGLIFSLILGLKFAYAPMLVAVSLLGVLRWRKEPILWNSLRLFSGIVSGAAPIGVALGISGSLIGYIEMMEQNFRYRNVYPAIVGQDGSILGHLANVNSFGASVFLLIFTPIVLAFVAFQSRKSNTSTLVLSLSLVSASVVGFLSLTAMWEHHLQVLTILVWSSVVSLGLILDNEVSFRSKSGLFLISLVSLTSLSAGLSLDLRPQTDLSKLASPRWTVPPEINEIQMFPHQTTITFGRLGANDDLGLAAFLPENWSLACPRYAQFGHEDLTTIDLMIQCVSEEPDVIFVAPSFYNLERFAGNLDIIRDGMTEVLSQKFECSPVANRDSAYICTRKSSWVSLSSITNGVHFRTSTRNSSR